MAGVMLTLFVLFMGAAALLVFVTKLQEHRGQPNSPSLPPVYEETPATVVETEGLVSIEGSSAQVLQLQFPVNRHIANGQMAPDFILRTLKGDWVSLADFRGQPVIINFWASWCGACREEAPELVHAYEQHLDKGLVILAVDTLYLDNLADVQDFVDEFALPFPILLDESGTVTDDMYHILGVPISIFVARDGRVQNQYIGAMSGKQLAEWISEISQGTNDS